MFEIHSLQIGQLWVPYGGVVECEPVYSWYVTDGKTRILVDSAMPTAAELRAKLNVAATGGGHPAFRAALAEVGATPDSIDMIILTHLHFDHASNLELFPQACVVIQRDEIFHAIDSAPTQRIFYFKETLAGLLARKRPSALRLVDGDVALMDGIRLLKVPGHTPGMQVPIVTTARGKVALVSDLGDHYRNWFPADPRASRKPLRFLADTYLPSSVRSESEAVYVGSMRRVQESSDIVIPAHDFRIPKHMPQEWFAIPDAPDSDHGGPPPQET